MYVQSGVLGSYFRPALLLRISAISVFDGLDNASDRRGEASGQCRTHKPFI